MLCKRGRAARLEHLAEGEDPGLRGEEFVVLDRVPRIDVLVPLACRFGRTAGNDAIRRMALPKRGRIPQMSWSVAGRHLGIRWLQQTLNDVAVSQLQDKLTAPRVHHWQRAAY